MTDQPILTEKDGELDVTTPSAKPAEGLDPEAALKADNAILRKQVLAYRDTVNTLYNALYTTREALQVLIEGIDALHEARKLR
jgi:hypothetical protein